MIKRKGYVVEYGFNKPDYKSGYFDVNVYKDRKLIAYNSFKNKDESISWAMNTIDTYDYHDSRGKMVVSKFRKSLY